MPPSYMNNHKNRDSHRDFLPTGNVHQSQLIKHRRRAGDLREQSGVSGLRPRPFSGVWKHTSVQGHRRFILVCVSFQHRLLRPEGKGRLLRPEDKGRAEADTSGWAILEYATVVPFGKMKKACSSHMERDQ